MNQIQGLSPKKKAILKENKQLKETALNLSKTLESFGKIATLQSQMFDAILKKDQGCLPILIDSLEAEFEKLQGHVSCLKTYESDSSEMRPSDLGCFRQQSVVFNDSLSLNSGPNQTGLLLHPGNPNEFSFD